MPNAEDFIKSSETITSVIETLDSKKEGLQREHLDGSRDTKSAHSS